jgi:hypothetical protein
MNDHLKLISIVSAGLQYPTMAVALGLPIWRIAKTGHFWPSFLRMWLYMILWTILFSMFIPGIVAALFHDKRAWNYFPEGPAVMGMILGGWISCLVLCAITLGLRNVWMYFHSRSD